MKNKNRLEEKFVTKEGYKIEITEKSLNSLYTIRFLIDGYIVKNLLYNKIKTGTIPYPKHKTVFGIGYIGVGKYTTSLNNKPNKVYQTWYSIMRRSYSKIFKEKNKSYHNVIVCDEWHNFQNFAQWFEENYNTSYMQNWELDKDILVKGNKVYSPSTCCFVPQEINKVFTLRQSCRGKLPLGVRKQSNGKFKAVISLNNTSKSLGVFNTELEAFLKYKKTKENYIIFLRDKYKNFLNKEVFNALINYKIEIND